MTRSPHDRISVPLVDDLAGALKEMSDEAKIGIKDVFAQFPDCLGHRGSRSR
jgi:hypothetical protein